MDKATLVLDDGSAYVGRAFGARVQAAGEINFTTKSVGGVEGLTDPRCEGRMILHTFPILGGYGVIPQDFLSDGVRAAAAICRAWEAHPSNWRAQGNIDALLRESGVPGICGIDTRALMRKLRDRGGATRGVLVQGEAGDVRVPDAAPALRPPKRDRLSLPGEGPRVLVVDLGCGDALARALSEQGAQVVLADIGDLHQGGYDAIALSDGSEELLGADLPPLPGGVALYGEGLGHLWIARERGGRIARMKGQHGGANLPVKWGDRVYITDQFHCHSVAQAPQGAKEVVRHLDDQTVEALIYRDALSVQFTPSAQSGPHDMRWVYDRFLAIAAE